MKAETGEHWIEHVHPHVYKYVHNLSVIDVEHSNWPDNAKGNYIAVFKYDVRPGKKGQTAYKALKKISKKAKKHGWPHPWSWFYPVNGEARLGLAIPSESYAAMEDTQGENFMEFMSKHMKKKKMEALFDDIREGIESGYINIYELNEDLSMEMKKKE